MSENEKLIKMLEIQRNDLIQLLNRNKEKYSQRQIDTLESEIEGLQIRINKKMGVC